MSKLDELIKKLCPNGVEYKTLGELGEFYGGITGKNKNDFVDGNAKFISYMNVYKNLKLNIDTPERVKISPNEKQRTLEYGDVIFTGSSETPDECGISSVLADKTEEKLYLNSFCICYRFNDPSMFNPEFSKYLFRSRDLRIQIGKTASGVTRFNVSKEKMKKVIIPIVPLKIQQEIVHILDNFTELTNELTNELTLRKKQYEHYRDKLLSFDDIRPTDQMNNGGGYTKIALMELFDIRNGYTPSTSNPDFWTDGTIPWFVMEDIRRNGRVLSDSMQHVTAAAVKGTGLFPANSIIVATSATIGEHALITSDFLCNQRFTCLSPKAEFRERIDMKFMFYYTFRLDEFCRQNTTQSSFASVDMKKFRRFEIPLPPLDVQERIVKVLDNFDAICSDLGIGLPAEIEKRRQQYEYYRDLLLTFSERGDTILTEQNRTEQNRTEQNRTEQNRTEQMR